MTISDLMILFQAHYMKTNLSPNTYRGYLVNIKNHITPYHGDKAPDELSYADIDHLVAELHKKGLSNTSINYVLATYRKALNFGIRRSYCSRNIIISYDKPRKEPYYPDTFNEDDLSALFQAESDSSLFPAVLLACVCGLRRGEAAGIKVDDISADRIRIRRTVTYDHGLKVTPCKSRRQRVVLIDRAVYHQLMRYHQSRPPNGEGYLLRNLDGSHVNPNSISKYFRQLCRKNGLPEIRFHDLRHTYATLMMEHGIHPKTVQQILGHSSIKVTLDLYSHASTQQQLDARDVLNKIKKDSQE